MLALYHAVGAPLLASCSSVFIPPRLLPRPPLTPWWPSFTRTGFPSRFEFGDFVLKYGHIITGPGASRIVGFQSPRRQASPHKGSSPGGMRAAGKELCLRVLAHVGIQDGSEAQAGRTKVFLKAGEDPLEVSYTALQEVLSLVKLPCKRF